MTQVTQTPEPTRRRAAGRWARTWREDLGPDERAAILSWGAFTVTFAGVRALTHWIRRGHGPAGGGMSLHGHHFHHYNLGIAGLAGLGALAVRAEALERIGEHPALPLSYGAATALIADEAALLLDLQDVYWSPQGRESVEIATGVIGLGGLAIALAPLVTRVTRIRRRSRRVG